MFEMKKKAWLKRLWDQIFRGFWVKTVSEIRFFRCNVSWTLILGSFFLGVNLLPFLKLVRIMLEIWDIHFQKNILLSTKTPINFADVRISFAKSQHFLAKTVPLLKAVVWEVCQKCLVLFSFFVRWKVNVSSTDHSSGIRLLDCFKLAINRKNNIYVIDVPTWRHWQVFKTLSCFSCQT